MSLRTLVIISILVGLAGVAVALRPDIEFAVTTYFFDRASGAFPNAANPQLQRLRDIAMWIVAAPVVLALIGLAATLILKVASPRRTLPFSIRAAIFLLATIVVAPGLVANKTLKDHWGRYRPIGLIEYGGTDPFVPFWDPRGTCYENCSFISGEGSGAFWMIAPAALLPPPARPLAYAAVVAFGAATGLLRISFGAHFLTDVIFAGYITYLIVWLAYAVIYRWPATRLSDDAMDRALTRAGLRLRALLRGEAFRL